MARADLWLMVRGVPVTECGDAFTHWLTCAGAFRIFSEKAITPPFADTRVAKFSRLHWSAAFIGEV
jgi:hypothetical protein